MTNFLQQKQSMPKLLAPLILVFVTASAHAGIIVDVQDAVITAGGDGTIDVLIRADAGTHDINLFNYEFAISSDGGNVGSLQFQDPQSLAEVTDANYIFVGDSTASTASQMVTPTTLIGDDATASFTDVTLTTANRLLVRLDVSHILPGGTDPATALSDTFTITPTFGGNFFFEDAAFSGPAINETLSSGGTATFGLASAVPEPTTAMLVLFPLSVTACRFRRRRKTLEDEGSPRDGR